MLISLVLAIIVFCILLLAIRDGVLILRAIQQLKDMPMPDENDEPRVSVIIPARNEEERVEVALASILSQDYPHLEAIIVDDRSTDGTKAILERMARAHDRLKVIHVDEIPTGWLGKTHALYSGAQRATGEYLLFADADIVMEKTAIRRAVSYLSAQGLDHLVVGPEVERASFLCNTVVLAFVLHFGLFLKPWKARDPRSRRYVGGGAFSFLRAEVYQAIGTMRAIAMCVDDDLKLGKSIKQKGFKQDFLGGQSMISLRWYGSLKEMVSGLTKNAFAALDYSVFRVVGATVFFSLVYCWPLAALLFTRGIVQFLYTLILLMILFLYWQTARLLRWPMGYAFCFALGTILLVYIFWRSTLATLWRRGIVWRGTFYALRELRK